MNDCTQCQDLQVRFEISHPSELRKAMRVAKDNVADGTLSVVGGNDEAWTTPFDQASVEGPWDDIVHYKFKCNHCGMQFSLSAETYHGRGGSWAAHG